MHDSGSAFDRGRPSRRDDGLGFKGGYVIREIAETRAFERRFLEKYDRVAIADPGLNTAVTADFD